MNANRYGRHKFHVVACFVLTVVVGHFQEPQSLAQDTSSIETRSVQSNLLLCDKIATAWHKTRLAHWRGWDDLRYP